MKNTLLDLNNHLFTALERMNDENIEPDEIDVEIKRSKAMVDIGKTIIDNGRLALDSKIYVDDRFPTAAPRQLPQMLESNKSNPGGYDA